MKPIRKRALDFEVDKLTNSIENTLTGEVFDTMIVGLLPDDLNRLNKKEWQFDWHKEVMDSSKFVYKLVTVNNPGIIHGLLSIEDKHDHIFMHLIESSKFNKGRQKACYGVPGNLVAFACKVSFAKGYQGFLAFDAKSVLIKHYQETLHARQIKGRRMYIETTAAIRLITKYFNS